MPNVEPRSGIRAYDLVTIARDVQREHGGYVSWQIGLPVRERTGVAVTVRAAFQRRGSGGPGSIYERGAVGAFPAGGGTTLIGELYRLTLELSKRLDEEKEEAERARVNRLPGF